MDGFERIKLMEKEINNPFLTKIVKYLLTRNDMEKMFLNEEKTLNEMLEYIEYKAFKLCENDKKSLSNGKGKYSCLAIDDNSVYTWAILYFTFTNEKLGIKEIKKQQIISNITAHTSNLKKCNPNTNISKNDVKKEQLSLFNVEEK